MFESHSLIERTTFLPAQIEVTCQIDDDLVVFGGMTINPVTTFYPARFQEDPTLYRRRFDFEREDGSYKCPREVISEVQLMIGSVYSQEVRDRLHYVTKLCDI